MRGNLKQKPALANFGSWGGDHIRITVREGGANVEYDCAHGTITEPVKLDSEGRFDLRGTFVREGPGPIRLGITRVEQAARYAGRVSGETMTLRVVLADTRREIGTFTLGHDSEGRIRKCR
jgi:hypothetical protein